MSIPIGQTRAQALQSMHAPVVSSSLTCSDAAVLDDPLQQAVGAGRPAERLAHEGEVRGRRGAW